MITVVGGIKGGSGKTTISTNLAVLKAQTNKILLVDADEQRSAWDWSQQRDAYNAILKIERFSTVCMSGKAIYSNLIRLKQDYDHIIVDTGGRDTTSQRAAIAVADKLILPFKPSSIDVWTIGPLRTILSECINPNLKVYAVVSQADPIGKDNQDALEILKEFTEVKTLDCTIGNRKAFRNAAAEGLSIFEMTPLDKKACKEFNKIYELIYT